MRLLRSMLGRAPGVTHEPSSCLLCFSRSRASLRSLQSGARSVAVAAPAAPSSDPYGLVARCPGGRQCAYERCSSSLCWFMSHATLGFTQRCGGNFGVPPCRFMWPCCSVPWLLPAPQVAPARSAPDLTHCCLVQLGKNYPAQWTGLGLVQIANLVLPTSQMTAAFEPKRALLYSRLVLVKEVTSSNPVPVSRLFSFFALPLLGLEPAAINTVFCQAAQACRGRVLRAVHRVGVGLG
jgi:hypothetical protein